MMMAGIIHFFFSVQQIPYRRDWLMVRPQGIFRRFALHKSGIGHREALGGVYNCFLSVELFGLGRIWHGRENGNVPHQHSNRKMKKEGKDKNTFPDPA
jgi:hypothetical protein